MAVMLRMKLCRFGRMVRGMMRVSVRRVCMVRCCFVVARLVMLRGLPVMFRCVLVMLRCFMVVLGGLLRHDSPRLRNFGSACRTLLFFDEQ